MKFINPISIIVIVTFFMGFLFLNRNKKIQIQLLFILFSSVVIEFISISLLSNDKNINLLYTIGFIIHNSLWISILFDAFKKKIKKKVILYIYILLAFLNFIFFEKKGLNNMTFVLGAIFYLVFLIIEIYINLKKEKLDFFNSNKFLLLLAPILFFFGFSFIFSFKNSEIRHIRFFEKIELYKLISYTINIIYYSLINLYIYKEYKLKNDL